MEYRKLNNEEIDCLKRQSCLADDWNRVEVTNEGFTTDYVWHTRFSGDMKLGRFE